MLPYWDCIPWSTILLNAYSLIVCIPFNFSRFWRSIPTNALVPRLTSTFRYFDCILRYCPSVLNHDCAKLDLWKFGDALLSIPTLIPLLLSIRLREVEDVGDTIPVDPNQGVIRPIVLQAEEKWCRQGSSSVYGCWSLYTIGYTSHMDAGGCILLDVLPYMDAGACTLLDTHHTWMLELVYYWIHIDDYLDCDSNLNVIWSIVDSCWFVGLFVTSRLGLICGYLWYFSFGFVWFVEPVWVSGDRRRVPIDCVWLCLGLWGPPQGPHWPGLTVFWLCFLGLWGSSQDPHWPRYVGHTIVKRLQSGLGNEG